MFQQMQDDEYAGKRKFMKKWNDFIEDFCYKDLETKEIYVPEDFMLLKLAESDNIVVINDDQSPPDGYETGSDGRARRTW